MNTVVRIILRLITLVLGISIVVFILLGSFWYIWQDAQGHAPRINYTITAGKLEQGILGLYLRSKGDAVTTPANPNDSREVAFVIESGETPGTVGQHLERLGLVTDGELFRRVVQYHGADGDIQVGVYLLRPNMTMEEIMREIQHGRQPSVRVTIPEGWRAEQIAELLEKERVTSAQDFMTLVTQGVEGYDFLADRPEGTPAGLEGFLFPDTYLFPLQVPADRVVGIFLDNWDTRMTDELRSKAAERKMTLYEVTTLAAIVEREAVIAEERPVIASVYLNRIQAQMPLQADPTVQYAKELRQKPEKWWSKITQEEYNTVVSPYNTYLNPGLPPGPICNPGLDSIKAVLEPAETSYLYFVAKGDGAHVFAATFEEHQRNVAANPNR